MGQEPAEDSMEHLVQASHTPCPKCRKNDITREFTTLTHHHIPLYNMRVECVACHCTAIQIFNHDPRAGWIGSAVLDEVACEVWNGFIRDLNRFVG